MKYPNKIFPIVATIAILLLTGCVSNNGPKVKNVATNVNTPVILNNEMRLPCSVAGELSYQKLLELGRVTVPPKNGKLSFEKTRKVNSRSCGKIMTFSRMIYTPNTGFIGNDTTTLSERWVYNIDVKP